MKKIQIITLISAISLHFCNQWGEQDSNLRRHEPTDLQSVPFDRFGIPPEKFIPLLFPALFAANPFTFRCRIDRPKEPAEGFEPTTGGLQNRCSAN